jgi:radical SAM protein with 4Fe4S-binding SPASM domain
MRDQLAREGVAPAADGRLLPHVVAWNLTRRCNLACSHCYISAGPWETGAGELDTKASLKIADQILAVNPRPMVILTGGEPLARSDLEILAEHLSSRGATCVVGTNGTGLTKDRIASLKSAGVTGFAVSVDSARSSYHDRFRHGDGALEATQASIDRLRDARLDFIVQTTVTPGNRHELAEIAAWSADKGAVSFNVYFLVKTGRAIDMRPLEPAENEAVLEELVQLQREYRGRMLVRSKCQPALMRLVHQRDPESPLLHYETRCPCGVQYCRITPEGKVTPCPYLPVEAGDLATQTFAEIWERSPVLSAIRAGNLGGKCGSCEYRQICGGCRARAYAEGGDYLGADESCAHQPAGGEVIGRQRSVTYGMSAEPTLEWTPGARARVDKIPSFVRGVVMSRVESYAQKRGVARIDEALIDEVRSAMPIDFSKRLPFFLKKKE